MKVLAAPTTIALLAASSMERIPAFTPISSPAVTRATAMRPAAPGAVAPISQSAFVASSPIRHRAPTTTTSSTTLAMKGNLVDRFVRVFNANVNKFVSGLEDPEKVIVQAVDDMQRDLLQIRQAYAEATAGQRRLQRQKEQADAEGDGWYTRANIALRRGNEGLAREALSRRQAFVEKSKTLEAQLNMQRTATDKLYEAMLALESKIKEAMAKKEQLVARARTAKSMQQVNDMLSGLGTGKNSMSAFTRMEEKVEALEAAAEASADMTLIPDSTLEAEFMFLEQSSEVDNELRKLKADLKMLGPATEIENMPLKKNKNERVYIPVNRGDERST